MAQRQTAHYHENTYAIVACSRDQFVVILKTVSKVRDSAQSEGNAWKLWRCVPDVPVVRPAPNRAFVTNHVLPLFACPFSLEVERFVVDTVFYDLLAWKNTLRVFLSVSKLVYRLHWLCFHCYVVERRPAMFSFLNVIAVCTCVYNCCETIDVVRSFVE